MNLSWFERGYLKRSLEQGSAFNCVFCVEHGQAGLPGKLKRNWFCNAFCAVKIVNGTDVKLDKLLFIIQVKSCDEEVSKCSRFWDE